MNLHVMKYGIAYIIPASVLFSFQQDGIWTFSAFFLAFIIIPIIELFVTPIHKNLDPQEIELVKNRRIYSYIVYLAVPVQLLCLYFFFEMLLVRNLSVVETLGVVSAMGIMCGVYGINIGHELGHRSKRYEQFFAEVLLLTSLENHFLPYHNYGHHRDVGTKKDPATARRDESVFAFWIRSHFTGYFLAWQIENRRMKQKKSIFANRMIWYTVSQFALLALIYYVYGIQIMFLFIAAAVFGILLLETVNYIEHYGLSRKKKENDKFERVQPHHSWNSDHILGRIILFELSRHSDHHYVASKHYQILDSTENSPQMPTGYPGMMLLSLIPPIWFRMMNKKIDSIEMPV